MIIIMMSLLLGTMITLSLPSVQTKLINKVNDYFGKKFGIETKIDYISIQWFDIIVLKGLQMNDTECQNMVDIDRLILDISFQDLFNKESIIIDKAVLKRPIVRLIRNAPDSSLNFSYFINQIRDEFQSGESSGGGAKTFEIGRIDLKEGFLSVFSSEDTTIHTNHNFDPTAFSIKEINGEIFDFKVDTSGILSLYTDRLNAKNPTDRFIVGQLQTEFSYSPQKMSFKNTHLEAEELILNGNIEFNYAHSSSLSYFQDSVKIIADLEHSRLLLSDLGFFDSSLDSMDLLYYFKGKFNGNIGDLEARNLYVQQDESFISGNIRMEGLPHIKETFIIADLKDSNFEPGFFKHYADTSTTNYLSRFGPTKINGNFTGFINDFVCNANFYSQVGAFSTDINFKVDPLDEKNSKYKGKLSTNNLNLGKLLADTINFGQITMNGSISGKGITADKANFRLDSKINKLVLRGYPYSNITTQAMMSKEIFNGTMSINDPNFIAESDSEINISKNNKSISVSAKIEKLALKPLHLVDRDININSEISINTIGLDPDEITGDISLQNLMLTVDNKPLDLDLVTISSIKDSVSRSFNITNKNINFSLFGDYKLSTFFPDAWRTFQEYMLNFENNPQELNKYYKEKYTLKNEYYYLDFILNLPHSNELIQLFYPEYGISDSTIITGSFTHGYNTILEMNTKIDWIKLGDTELVDNVANVYSSILEDTANIDATIFFESEKVLNTNRTVAENLTVDVDWNNKNIDYLFNVDSYNSDDYIRLVGNVFLNKEFTEINIKPSEIKAVGEMWHFNETNKIIIEGRNFTFDDLKLFSSNQKIELNGKLSENKNDNAHLSIANFNLASLNSLSDKEYNGTLNGYIDLKDFYNEIILNSRLTVRKFSINNFLLGDLTATVNYDALDKQFIIKSGVTRDQIKTIEVYGNLEVRKGSIFLDLNSKFQDTDISILQPFFESYLSELKGTANGEIAIRGKSDDLGMFGKGTISDGGLTLSLFNTKYDVDATLAFNNHKISLEKGIIHDIKGNQANLEGYLDHNFFSDLYFNLKGDFDKLQAVNLKEEDNDVFYGTAYGTGTIAIYGPEENLTIDVKAKTEKNTRILIPLYGSEEVGASDFIEFVKSREDSILLQEKEVAPIELQGVAVNLEIEATPDASVEIIFDIISGDIIRGRGNGKLTMKLNREGDFSMYGDYEIVNGGYNFTMSNIINKEFKIQPGSLISWSGDPYSAVLDINAIYSVNTSLSPIIDAPADVLANESSLNRSYPVDVLLSIKGNLSSPDIHFDINIRDYTKSNVVAGIGMETHVNVFKSKLKADEQFLNTQVFSLILLKRLQSTSEFNMAGAGASLGSSMSEFLSNQFNYWISQVDENLEFDIDLPSISADQLYTMQLRLSYSFMGGRLKVTRNGGFSNVENEADVKSVLGDWSVEYLLTKDGKLKAKVYNKTNYNNFENATQTNSYTSAGVSLMYTRSFDDFQRLLKKLSKEQEEQKGDGNSTTQKHPEAIKEEEE